MTAHASVQIESSRWWLRDPYMPERNMMLLKTGKTAVARDTPQQIHRPFGRSTPIVVSGDMQAATGKLDVAFDSQEDWQKFAAIVSEEVLLLQSPFEGEQWWVRFTAPLDMDVEDNMLRTCQLDWVEVDPPEAR